MPRSGLLLALAFVSTVSTPSPEAAARYAMRSELRSTTPKTRTQQMKEPRRFRSQQHSLMLINSHPKHSYIGIHFGNGA